MANLSNINGKFLFTDGDFLLIGGATANSISATESGVAIKNSNAATLSLQNSATNGKNHTLWSNTDGSFNITDVGVATRFTIASGGDVYFPETLRLGIGINSIYPQGGDTILKLYSASGGSSLYLQNASTGSATTDGSKIWINNTDLTITNMEGETRFFNEGFIMMNISKFDGSANSNPLTSSNIRIWAHSKTGWLPGDILSKIEFYSNDVSGIGARNAASIRVVNEDGNGSTTTTFSGSLAFYTSAYNSTEQEAVRIGSSGNVGIGTSDLTGVNTILDLKKTGTNRGTNIRFKNDYNSNLYIGISGDSSGNALIYNQNNSDIVMYTGASGTERMRIDSSGNVGIGTNSPAYKLAIEDAAADIFYGATDATSGSMFRLRSNNKATTIFDINANGNVEAPVFLRAGGNINNVNTFTYTLQSRGLLVAGNSGTSQANLYLHRDDVTVVSGNVIGNLHFSSMDGGSHIGAQIQSLAEASWSTGSCPARLVFNTVPSGSTTLEERMRITSGGDVLIGCTSSPSNTVFGAGIQQHTSVDGTYFENSINSTSTVTHCQFANPNGNVGFIKTSGSSTSYITSSDYRLKENVVEMTGALDRVSQLKPSRFNFIADADKTVDGFLAHEVQEIVPEAISGEKDAVDEEGNPEYQGIDQSKLVPLLVGAIQELKAEIEQLKTQINN